MKVAIVDGSVPYKHLFENGGHEIVHRIEDADLVCFTGGEDVTPALYKAHKHPFTHNSEARDAREKEAFEICRGLDIPMVGICRGGQFLNVMSGGAMYQHVSKHAGDHDMTDLLTGEIIRVSSTHHQMFKPAGNAIILATANQGGTREWYEGAEFFADVSEEDYEVIYYEETQSLCFQPHPEFSGERYGPMKDYFYRLIETIVMKETS